MVELTKDTLSGLLANLEDQERRFYGNMNQAQGAIGALKHLLAELEKVPTETVVDTPAQETPAVDMAQLGEALGVTVEDVTPISQVMPVENSIPTFLTPKKAPGNE